MYTLHQWKREYWDSGEYMRVSKRLTELTSNGLFVPSSAGDGLTKFLGDCLLWDHTVGRVVNGGPEQVPLLTVGAVYKRDEKPEIIDEIQDMLGKGRVTEIPAGSFDLEKLASKI